MKTTTTGACVLTVAALALTSACSSSGSGAASDSGTKTLKIFSLEPTSLLPQIDTGTQIGMATCANLMEVNAENKKLEPLVAKSLESKDNQHWTVKLRPWKFQDGTAVTAASYVDAWNATAYAPNGYAGNGMFTIFQGYADLNPKSGTPKAKELSGAKAVDDSTIEISLNSPNSTLPQILSANPTCPLPKAYFDNPDAYQDKPVGNGPYEFASWEHNQQIVLKKWKDFPGSAAFSGGADELDFKIYTDMDAGYSDLVAGNLDIIRKPEGAMAARAMSELGDKALFLPKERRNQQFLAFPAYLDKYRDVNLRTAISLAIDRDALIKSVLKGQAGQSDSLITPLFASYRKGACAVCRFDATEAKAKLAQAKGFDGSVQIVYQASASSDQIVEAISNQLQNTLGIKVELKPVLPAEIAAMRNKGKLTGIYFGGWGLSYVSEDQFLGAYTTGGDGNNVNHYSNPQVDALEAKALAATDQATATTYYNQVEDLVLADLPVTPLYLNNVYAIHTPKAEVVSSQGDIQQYRAKYVG